MIVEKVQETSADTGMHNRAITVLHEVDVSWKADTTTSHCVTWPVTISSLYPPLLSVVMYVYTHVHVHSDFRIISVKLAANLTCGEGE